MESNVQKIGIKVKKKRKKEEKKEEKGNDTRVK